jgi:hypothetical protein
MRPDRLPLFVVPLACVGFLCLLLVTVGPLGVGPGRPLELAQADNATPHGNDDAEAAHVLATITPAEADKLEGKRGRFHVQLDGPATAEGKYTLYEVVVTGANDLGTVRLAAGQDAEDGMIVEARLVVLRGKAWRAPGGEVVPAFTEFRLVDAKNATGR